MTITCLDCAHLELDRMPVEGHPCHGCNGKLVAVKINGPNFKARTCGNCEHVRGSQCELRIKHSVDLIEISNSPSVFSRGYQDPCVDYSAWKRAVKA